LVVVAIVGVLAAIALPQFSVYMVQGNLTTAHAYLAEIAAKNRMRFNERGTYLGSKNEDNIETELGIDLSSTGDFCFIIKCLNSTVCGVPAATPTETLDSTFVSTAGASDQAIQFEVWAILRNATDNPVSTALSSTNPTCTAHTDKPNSSGWVSASGGGPGSEGQVVVLRFPSPVNGQGNAGNGITFDWVAGVSNSDALQD
jgi:Tfp pilus assembly protein PilE